MERALQEALAKLELYTKRGDDKRRVAGLLAQEVGRRYEIQVAAHHMTATGKTVWTMKKSERRQALDEVMPGWLGTPSHLSALPK